MRVGSLRRMAIGSADIKCVAAAVIRQTGDPAF